jgi:hypothetical protein
MFKGREEGSTTTFTCALIKIHTCAHTHVQHTDAYTQSSNYFLRTQISTRKERSSNEVEHTPYLLGLNMDWPACSSSFRDFKGSLKT